MRAFKQANGINFTVTKKASFPREPQRNETTELPCRLLLQVTLQNFRMDTEVTEGKIAGF